MTGIEALLLGFSPLAMFISAACSAVIMATSKVGGVARLLHREVAQVQDIHDTPTLRLGGIGVIAAFAVGAVGLFASESV